MSQDDTPFFVVGLTGNGEPECAGPYGPMQIEPRQAALRQMRKRGHEFVDVVRAADRTDALRIAHERAGKPRRSHRHRG